MLNASLAGVSYSYLIFIIKCQPNRHVPFFASTTWVNRALLSKKTSKWLLFYLKWMMGKRRMILEWSYSLSFDCIYLEFLMYYLCFQSCSNLHRFLIPMGPVSPSAETPHLHSWIWTHTGMETGQLNIIYRYPVSITRCVNCWRGFEAYLLNNSTTYITTLPSVISRPRCIV